LLLPKFFMQELPKNKEELVSLLDELIAARLVQKAEQKGETASPPPPPKGEQIVNPPQDETVALSSVEFAKVEKNLASLGFFTPSSKRIKDAKAKTVSISAVVNGNRVEAKATILPAALYGLPITADQDKYLALQKVITDLRQQQGGRVTNPVSFTSAELLTVLHNYRDSGKNYQDIDEWLNVMASTTIISEGAVYLAGKKRWVKDRFHVFDRAVSFGKELEPGKVADKNYVWLSDWQLENINSNHLIPVDLDTYRELKNHIAKTLVPLLQIWLYASRDAGTFEKRYDELCQILSIREYQYLSRIKEQLGPSLDELQQHGYIEAWSTEETSDGKAYKIVLRHGEKFHRDRHTRLAQNPSVRRSESKPLQVSQSAGRRQAFSTLHPQVDSQRLLELTQRGIGDSGARKLLATLPNDRPLVELLEWGDAEIARQPGRIANPAGFYIRLLQEHSAPPPTFQSSRAKKAREQANFAQQEALLTAHAVGEAREDEQRRKAQRRFDSLTPDRRQMLCERFKAELFVERPFMARQKSGSVMHERAVHARLMRYLAEEPVDLLVVPQPTSLSESTPTVLTIARLLEAQRDNWTRLNQSVDQ